MIPALCIAEKENNVERGKGTGPADPRTRKLDDTDEEGREQSRQQADGPSVG